MISSFIFWFCGPSPILQSNVRQYAPPLYPLSCYFVRIMEKSFSTLEVVGEIFPEISAQLSSHVIKRWQRWIGSDNQQGRFKEGGGSEKICLKSEFSFFESSTPLRQLIYLVKCWRPHGSWIPKKNFHVEKFCRRLLTSSLKREIENYSN